MSAAPAAVPQAPAERQAPAEPQAVRMPHAPAERQAPDVSRAAVVPTAPASGGLAATASADAEHIRRLIATAWGDVGSTWGFPPATARVHGYLLASRRPLTEREIRLALGLSHRAASLALAEVAAWGLVERVPEPRRAGSRGPAGAAWAAIDDHWRWFGRVVEQRRLRQGGPAVAAIEGASSAARAAADGRPDDPDLGDLRMWLDDVLAFVRLVDRMAALMARVPPRDLERAMRLAAQVPDYTMLRLLDLLAAQPDGDVLPLLDALARLSPSAAPGTAGLFAGVLRRLEG